MQDNSLPIGINNVCLKERTNVFAAIQLSENYLYFKDLVTIFLEFTKRKGRHYHKKESIIELKCVRNMF